MSVSVFPPSSGGITQLTGDVTAGPGSGSVAATIANDAVTYAKIQNVSAASRLLGRESSGAGDVEEISLGTGLQISGTTISTVGGSSGSGNVVNTGAYGSEPGSPATGDLYFPDNAFFIERYSGSLWVPWGPIYPLTQPISGDFSWINQGAGAIATTNGGVYLTSPSGGTDNVRARVKSQPSTPYTITALVQGDFIPTNYLAFGLVFRESATGKIILWSHGWGNGNITNSRWNSATSFGSTVGAIVAMQANNYPLWLRLSNDGTTLLLQYSMDGINFVTGYSQAKTTFFTTAPDQVGFAMYVNNGSVGGGGTLMSWKEA